MQKTEAGESTAQHSGLSIKVSHMTLGWCRFTGSQAFVGKGTKKKKKLVQVMSRSLLRKEASSNISQADMTCDTVILSTKIKTTKYKLCDTELAQLSLRVLTHCFCLWAIRKHE
jgi:hypothetical protein